MADEQNIGAGLEERIIDADIDADSNREENRADFELEMIEKLKSGKCSIEYALLVASGLKDKKDIRRYQGKLRRIIKDFKEDFKKISDYKEEFILIRLVRNLHPQVAATVPLLLLKDYDSALTKVFKGSYQNVGKWAMEMAEYVKGKGKEIKKLYFSYTTCPKCAKAYGKNYVVLFAQIN